MLNRSKCVIIVPTYSHIEQPCEDSLQGLEDMGFRVWRRNYGAAIDVSRSRLASEALDDGYDEIMWIDSDIAFDPEDVERLRDHQLPLVAAGYPKKGQAAMSFHTYDTSMVMGERGGLVEVVYAATGFLHTRRALYDAMRERFQMPLCNEVYGTPFYPFFLPQVVPYRDGHWYLAEDYSFCERARQCGVKVLIDTSIRLYHIGSYAYSWEDACGDRTRFQTFTMGLDVMQSPAAWAEARARESAVSGPDEHAAAAPGDAQPEPESET